MLVLSKMLSSKSSKTRHQILGTLNMYVIFITFGFDTIKDLTEVQCRTTCCPTRSIWKSLSPARRRSNC